MLCIYNRSAVFDWDENNLRKIRAHRIKSEGVEQGLSNGPILIYEQDAQGEPRYVYYCESDAGRLLAAVVIERASGFGSLPRTIWTPRRKGTTWPGECEGVNP